MKHHLKLLKITVTIMVQISGVLPLFSHWQMAYNSDGTAAWTSAESPLCPSAQLE